MRLRWLKWGLLTAVLLAAACGRQPQGLSESPAQDEEAVLKSITAVSPEAERVLSAPLTPRTDELPALPFADHPLHVTSAVQTFSRNGAESYTSGGGASDVGSSKLLS